MKVIDDISACPFCGHNSAKCFQEPYRHRGPMWRVECMCGGCGPIGLSVFEAIVEWNRRAPSEQEAA